MSARAYALMTGVFILALVSAIGVAIYWFGGTHVARNPYVVVAHQSVMGLHPQSTVYYRGVPVGDVASIRLDPGSAESTLISIDIDATIPVTAGTYATLLTKGVTGLATLELNDTGGSSQRLTTSLGKPAHIPLTAGSASLAASAKTLGTKLNSVADSLQKIVNSDNRHRIDTILANTAQLTTKLDKALRGLPAITHHADATLGQINTLATRLIGLTDTINTVAAQMKGIAANGNTATRELVTQTLPQLGATLKDLQRTARALTSLSKSLGTNPQQLLLGPTAPYPTGPGEPGFSPPASK